MKNYEEVINLINSGDRYKLKNDILKYANDPEFLKIIIKIHNPMIFDHFIKLCEFKMDTSSIYEERNKFMKKSIDNLTEENIYEFFEITDLEESRQKVIANRYLTEYIITYYFQDSFYNFMTNFYLMTHYLTRDRKDLVSMDHIKIYQEFLDLKDYSIEDKIKLFNRHLNDDLMGMFYDDINTVREDSHKKLVECSLKIHKDNGIYRKDLSDQYGRDVYYLDGEEFYGFVRCVSGKRIKDEEGFDDYDDYVYSRFPRVGYSFSYISSNNLGTASFFGNNILLYYDNIDYRNIMYVHHTDMNTGINTELDSYVSSKENEVLTPNGLISSTINYNEIFIKPGMEGIKPTAVVCRDTISDVELAFAKEFDLPILLINREKYKSFPTYEDDLDRNTYVL